jgi:hypothetical protein
MTQVQKNCVVCGRRMAWRRRWRMNWEDVRYCSKACRRRGLTETDRNLETAILAFLKKQRAGAGIVLDEVVAMVTGADARRQQTPLLPAARSAARRLCNQGAVDILQHGRPADPSTAKGRLRIRLRPRE